VKARIYLRGWQIAETAVELPTGIERGPAPADDVTVVLFDDHPKPGERRLFGRIKLEHL
jgi:hypothetical protein